MHSLLPDVVLVGGTITAVNNCVIDDSSINVSQSDAPMIVKRCVATWCASKSVASTSSNGSLAFQSVVQPADLSDALYMPGRGGGVLPLQCLPSSEEHHSRLNLRCSCVLRGKYCATASF